MRSIFRPPSRKPTSVKLAIRTDASPATGIGHFMRCLTLADAVAAQGGQIRFVSQTLVDPLPAMLARRGYEFISIPANEKAAADGDLAHSAWLQGTMAADARATLSALGDHSWDWLAVDHYALDARWERAVRPAAARILAIDDLADRRHDCDLLLDQNLHATTSGRYQDKLPAACALLAGPDYALLREEFAHWRDRRHPADGRIRQIFVFFGGIDAENLTGRALAGLAALTPQDFRVKVVIGGANPHRANLAAGCERYGYELHVQSERMAELMAESDLAIGAAGTSSWERCCLGLPALLVSLADNQLPIARSVAERGAGLYLGSHAEVTVAAIGAAVEGLRREPARLAAMARTAAALVDGQGVQRVMVQLKERS